MDVETPSLEDLGFMTKLMLDNLYTDIKPLPGHRYAAISQLIFTVGIVVGDIGDHTSVGARFCYHNYAAAKAALEAWDGAPGTEPEGWHRAPHSGRRRPDGDPAQEYVDW